MTGLTELEEKFLNIASEAFKKRITLLTNIGGNKDVYEVGAGIEGYIQTVLLNAYMEKGLSVSMRGKKERDCDIIIEDIGIELKAELKINHKTFYKNMFTEHPNADLYMFLSRSNIKDDILEYFSQEGHVVGFREIDSNWIICLGKRKSQTIGRIYNKHEQGVP